MLITSATLNALRTGFATQFQNNFDNAPSVLSQIATVVPSTTKSNTYGWLGQWPGMREWVGDRVLKDISEHAYAITNKDWESSVGVKRTDIEDDQLGVYMPLMAEMGRAAAVYPDEHAFALLKAGDSTLCYDGQNFFDTDHPVFANADGTGAATTVSNMAAGAGPAWFLMDTSRSLRPLIFQNRKSPVFTSMSGNEDEAGFTKNEYRFGVDARSAVGFGFWQQAYMSKADLTPENFEAAFAAMGSIKANGGRPMNVKATVLVVPPSLRAKALAITKSEFRVGGESNVNSGVVETLVTPWVL